MPADAKTPDGFSLRRWSRRKLEAARESASREAVPLGTLAEATKPGDSVPVTAVPSTPPMPTPESPPTLASVESLTIDSDFTAFFQPQVDQSLKRQALKKLFADPRFNVMDGLDVYIDDYTKSDPIPPDILERLVKGHFGFNPPPSPVDPPREPTVDTIAAADPATSIPVSEPAASVETATTLPAASHATPDTASAADAPDPAKST